MKYIAVKMKEKEAVLDPSTFIADIMSFNYIEHAMDFIVCYYQEADFAGVTGEVVDDEQYLGKTYIAKVEKW